MTGCAGVRGGGGPWIHEDNTRTLTRYRNPRSPLPRPLPLYHPSGGDFGAEDYMLPTPPWAAFGSEAAGFDPGQVSGGGGRGRGARHGGRGEAAGFHPGQEGEAKEGGSLAHHPSDTTHRSSRCNAAC